MNENHVTGPYGAVVNGKHTGLAGCATANCSRSDRCLRADPTLAMRQPYECGAEARAYIPITKPVGGPT